MSTWLKEWPQSISIAFKLIFNRSLEFGEISYDWKQTNAIKYICLYLKRNRKDPSIASLTLCWVQCLFVHNKINTNVPVRYIPNE